MGELTLTQPELPQFDEPWQAEALALSMALVQAGRFICRMGSEPEFCDRLFHAAGDR